MNGPYRWVVLREGKAAGALTRILGLPLVQYALNGIDALYDLIRFVRFFTPVQTRPEDRRKLEALILVHSHKIEKTLALPRPPALFGTNSLGPLLDLLGAWVRSTGDSQAVVFRAASAALLQYRHRVGTRLAQEFPTLAARLDEYLTRYAPPESGRAEGGTRRLTADEFRFAVGAIDFEGLARLRHSVRTFSPDPVPDEAVSRAVGIAQRSPSVCNRQAWRVHVYTSPQDKVTVLQTQNGNSGFGHLAARILLVSSDARTYVTSGERHQAYVDGGMFAMSLVYALEAEGIVSCCLNLCNYFFQDLAVHRACRIPAWELPIMMIAIGYPAPEFEVAASARLDTSSVLSWRTL